MYILQHISSTSDANETLTHSFLVGVAVGPWAIPSVPIKLALELKISMGDGACICYKAAAGGYNSSYRAVLYLECLYPRIVYKSVGGQTAELFRRNCVFWG